MKSAYTLPTFLCTIVVKFKNSSWSTSSTSVAPKGLSSLSTSLSVVSADVVVIARKHGMPVYSYADDTQLSTSATLLSMYLLLLL